MYGLLLQNMQEYVVKTYGQNKWDELKAALKIKEVSNTKDIAQYKQQECEVSNVDDDIVCTGSRTLVTRTLVTQTLVT